MNASRSECFPEKVVILIKARLQAVIFGRADGLFQAAKNSPIARPARIGSPFIPAIERIAAICYNIGKVSMGKLHLTAA